MKKNLLLILFLFALCIKIDAQQLCYHQDGTFKIVQFTDTHVVPEKKESLDAIKLIDKVLEKEQPI